METPAINESPNQNRIHHPIFNFIRHKNFQTKPSSSFFVTFFESTSECNSSPTFQRFCCVCLYSSATSQRWLPSLEFFCCSSSAMASTVFPNPHSLASMSLTKWRNKKIIISEPFCFNTVSRFSQQTPFMNTHHSFCFSAKPRSIKPPKSSTKEDNDSNSVTVISEKAGTLLHS